MYKFTLATSLDTMDANHFTIPYKRMGTYPRLKNITVYEAVP